MIDGSTKSTSPHFDIDKLAEALQRAVCTTLNDTFKVSTHIDSCYKGNATIQFKPGLACALEIRQSGAPFGTLFVVFSPEVIAKVLQAFGVPNADDPVVIGDAVEEIINMIYGVIKASLNTDGGRLDTAFPVALGTNHPKTSADPHGEKVALTFYADGYECQAMVVLNDAGRTIH